MQQIAKEIHSHLRQATGIVVVPHQHPDGDALGAAAALHEYLSILGKTVFIFCATPPGKNVHFVPKAHLVGTDPAIFSDPRIDTVILVDSGDLRYAGVNVHLQNKNLTIINIDHHNTNEHFGRHNLVRPTASSTCEVLFHYFYHNHIAVNSTMATALLAGVTTDTGNFTNSATSATALKITGQLVRAGGNIKTVYANTTRNKSLGSLHLWGIALGRLEKIPALGVTYTYLTLADFAECGVADTESEGIANFLNNLDDSTISLILKELPDGQVKGSFRTTKDGVDVSALAKALGGGGHKKAAGFTVAGPVEAALARILTLTEERVKMNT